MSGAPRSGGWAPTHHFESNSRRRPSNGGGIGAMTSPPKRGRCVAEGTRALFLGPYLRLRFPERAMHSSLTPIYASIRRRGRRTQQPLKRPPAPRRPRPQDDLPTLLPARAVATAFGQHLVFKFQQLMLGDADRTGEGGYMGRGFGAIWRPGLGRTSACGISGGGRRGRRGCPPEVLGIKSND